MSVLSYASTCVFFSVHVTSVCVYDKVSKIANSDTLISCCLMVITFSKDVLLNSREIYFVKLSMLREGGN
jgi:hypothetical protein